MPQLPCTDVGLHLQLSYNSYIMEYNITIDKKMEAIMEQVTLQIQYLNDTITRLEYIDGKSDWIDLRAADG